MPVDMQCEDERPILSRNRRQEKMQKTIGPFCGADKVRYHRVYKLNATMMVAAIREAGYPAWVAPLVKHSLYGSRQEF